VRVALSRMLRATRRLEVFHGGTCFYSLDSLPSARSRRGRSPLLLPLCCGGASLFHTWPDDLPPQIEVCSIQLPGRESRFNEARYCRLPPLIPVLEAALRPYLSKPFAFFGHSLGALVSFELTRYLREQGGPLPICLLVAGHRAPHLPRKRPPAYPLPAPAFMEELRRLDGVPEEVLENAELMELVLPLLRADFAMAETYEYRPDSPLNCPITAFGGLADPDVNQEELLAWKEQTTGYFTLQMLAGDHFFVHSSRAELLQGLAQAIMQAMN